MKNGILMHFEEDQKKRRRIKRRWRNMRFATTFMLFKSEFRIYFSLNWPDTHNIRVVHVQSIYYEIAKTGVFWMFYWRKNLISQSKSIFCYRQFNQIMKIPIFNLLQDGLHIPNVLLLWLIDCSHFNQTIQKLFWFSSTCKF